MPVNKRHLDMVYAHIKYSDKPLHGLGHRARARRGHGRDGQARVRRRLRREQLACTLSLINANSPMVFDETMVGALKVYARAQPGACIVTPFILSGAMSPVTVAGTLTQILGRGAGRRRR